MQRARSRGRPGADPACAGCVQLGLFRALGRAGLDVQGGSGCAHEGDPAFVASPGRWAAVAGARRILAGAAAAIAEADAAGARLLVLADRDGPEGRRAARLLADARATVVPLDGRDAAAAEATARAASLRPGSAVVALTPCAREARRRSPVAVAASRCNRCGACLSLGCAAISDPGGEAMAIDPGVCTGCGLCAPLCRARAIAG
jgi:Pyruvate/2-oxoacid:ferredoxin oxidoreductase delta subunit